MSDSTQLAYDNYLTETCGLKVMQFVLIVLPLEAK